MNGKRKKKKKKSIATSVDFLATEFLYLNRRKIE